MKLLTLLLFTTILFSQESIVAAGNQTETFGEAFPIMQQVDTLVVEVPLGVPTFELPEPPKPKPAAKKKSFFEKLIEAILKLFKK